MLILPTRALRAAPAWASIHTGLSRDLALCLGTTLVGVRIDGIAAFAAMQGFCGRNPWDVWAQLSAHMALMPATSALMLLVAAACWRNGRPPAGQGRPSRLRAFVGDALGGLMLFAAMLAAMGFAQWPMRHLVHSGPFSAVLASLSGMGLLVVAWHCCRGEAARPGIEARC